MPKLFIVSDFLCNKLASSTKIPIILALKTDGVKPVIAVKNNRNIIVIILVLFLFLFPKVDEKAVII